MKLILSIFIGYCLVATSTAQDAPVGDKPGNSEKGTPAPKTKYADLNDLVKRIRDGFEKAVKKSDAQRDVKIDALNQSYLNQLEQLQRFYNDSGNAASALTTRDEIKRITEKTEIQADQLKGDGLGQLQKKRKLYSEARKKIVDSNTAELKRLFGLGNEALKKRASELTRKGELDRVEALTSVIPSWAGRPDLISEHNTDGDSATKIAKKDWLLGKTVSFPHDRKPDFDIRVVFKADGEATFIGLGNLEVKWVYDSGKEPFVFLFWHPTLRTREQAWQVKIDPEGKTGTVKNVMTGYTAKAKIKRSRR